MAPIINFYGYSDDLIECETSDKLILEDYLPSNSNSLEIPVVSKENFNKGVIVVATYTKTAGTWALGLSPLKEDSEIPNWIFSISPISSESNYSATLTIDTYSEEIIIKMDKFTQGENFDE